MPWTEFRSHRIHDDSDALGPCPVCEEVRPLHLCEFAEDGHVELWCAECGGEEIETDEEARQALERDLPGVARIFWIAAMERLMADG